MKIGFYFRTRNEYCEVFDYVQALNAETRKHPKFRNTFLLRIHTRYLADDQNWDSKIPKERVGNKKYLGIIHGNKYLMNLCDVQPEEFLKTIGREVVKREAGTAKYDGEKTLHKTILRTPKELKTITSVFNKRYGHGCWRIQGPKKLQHILKTIEPKPNTISSPWAFSFGDEERDLLIKRYPGGVHVTLIVNEPNAEIDKQLFKAVLKG